MKFLNSIKKENEIYITFKSGRIFDEMSISHLGVELIAEADNCPENTTFILDFLNVDYLSSAALGKIITVNKKLKEKNSSLILKNMNSDIHEIFVITKLDKFFKIEI